MQVIITRQFEKDSEKELNKKLQQQLAGIIELLQKADHLLEIPHLKKMKVIQMRIESDSVIIVSAFFLKTIQFCLAG